MKLRANTFVWAVIAVTVGIPFSTVGQAPAELERERSDFAEWLRSSPVSPYAAVYHQLLDGELVFGPDAPPPLNRLPEGRIEQGRLRLSMETSQGTRTVPRNRTLAVDAWSIRVSGTRRREVVTVFGPFGDVTPPGWFPYNAGVVVDGLLEPPASRESRRMLGLDGVEIEASLAGTFVGEVMGVPLRLVVYRMPQPGSEESDLNVFFRDETNGNGTYTAGRFLALTPLGGNGYRADFNRARNPFCGYNSVFPCPLPWRGNGIPASIEAGELYDSKVEVPR